MFSRGSAYLVVWVLQFVTSIIVTPVLTRVLGPHSFGQAVLALTLFQVVIGLASLSLQSGLQRLYVEEHGAERARGVLFTSIFLTTAVVVVVYLTGGLWSREFGFNGYSELVKLTILWAGFGAVTLNCLGLLRSQDRLVPFAVVSIIQSVLSQVIAILAVILVHRTATVYLTGLVVGQVIATAVVVLVVRPSPRRAFDRHANLSTLAFSLPLVPSLLGAFVLNAGDRIVVKHYLGVVQVGRYQVAYNVGCFGILLLGVANQAWAPMFFKIKNDALRWEVLARMRDQVVGLLLPFIGAVCFGAPIVLRIWAPPSYHPDGLVTITAVVALSTLPYAAYIASIRILLWHKRTGLVAWASATAAVLNVFLNIIMVPHLGILGSALATLICYGWLGICAYFATRKFVVLRRPSWTVLLFALLAIVAAIIGARVPTSFPWMVVRTSATVGFGLWLVVLGRAMLFGREAASLGIGGDTGEAGGPESPSVAIEDSSASSSSS